MVLMVVGVHPFPQPDQSALVTPAALLFPGHAKLTVVEWPLRQTECHPPISTRQATSLHSPLLTIAFPTTESESAPVTLQPPSRFTFTLRHLACVFCLHVL